MRSAPQPSVTAPRERAPVGVRLVATACVSVAMAWTLPAHAKTVRVFAVGHKQRLVDATSYQAYRDTMFALVDASLPGRATLVQPGVDDVASHLQPSDPLAPADALVNFPEDAGLIAGLIGSRGANARAQTSSAAGIFALVAAYQPLVAHYTAEFGSRHPVGDVFVAATDTFYRSFYETFRDIAVAYGVYVTASADLAPARRIEEADDPALVALLRDPDEPTRSYAYEATSNLVRNVIFVFAPDGEILVPQPNGSTLRSPSQTGGVILPSVSKAYLTDLELALLGLVPSSVSELEVVDTPVGRIGGVISKDAWMIDVNERFEAKNAQILLQSEAFSSWAFTTAEWSPDVFKEGGFGNLQKYPSFLYNVAPSMTGNLFDITFDGQTTILGDKTKTDPGPLATDNAWIGQDPDGGFLAVAPWVVDDPGIANPAMTLADRRTQLATLGVELLPGAATLCGTDLAVGACENGYREAVIHHDLILPDGPEVLVAPDLTTPEPTDFGSNVRVHPPDGPTPSLQKNARVAARRSRVAVVWQDGRDGLPTVYLAISRDGGKTFGAPTKVSDHPAGVTSELLPAIAVAGGALHVVWQELEQGGDDDAGAILAARFNWRGRKRGSDVQVDGGVDATGKWKPSVAAIGRDVHVVWVDERDAGPQGQRFEHIYYARSHDRGRSFGAAKRIDQGAPVALASALDNKWAPAIAAGKQRVAIVWVDFRNYNWDVFGAVSADGGETFSSNVRIDDFGSANERLHADPAVALVGKAERIVAAWTDLRAREPDTNVFHAASDDGGATWSANNRLDRASDDVATPSGQWRPRLATRKEIVCSAWQDDRLGNNDVFFSVSSDGGSTFADDERVDDSGTGPSGQYNPDVAISGWGRKATCYVVWEDTRGGDSDIYLARREVP